MKRLVLIGGGILLILVIAFLFWGERSRSLFSDHSPESLESGKIAMPTGKWAEKIRQVIETAQRSGKNPKDVESLTHQNVSATIQEAAAINDPLERAGALAETFEALLAQRIGTNIPEILNALNEDEFGRQTRNGLMIPLTWYYIREDNKINAVSSIRSFFRGMIEYPLNPELPGQRKLLTDMLNAILVLNLTNESQTFFQNLNRTAETSRDAGRRESFYSYIAEQQIRLQETDSALATINRMTIPANQTKLLRSIIEDRLPPFSADLAEQTSPEEGGASLFSLANPERIRQALEQVFSAIANLQPEDNQLPVLRALFDSDMMCNPELRELTGSVLKTTVALPPTLKANALSIFDNPQNPSIRRSLGLATRNTEDSRYATDGSPDSRERKILRAPPVERRQLDEEDLRISINTALDLIKWGQKADATALLIRADRRSRGLFLDADQGVSRLTIASMLIALGDVGVARILLDDLFEILRSFPKSASVDSELTQLASLQMKSRLLEEAGRSIAEMRPSSPTRAELLHDLAKEQFQIGQFEDSLRTLRLIPKTASTEELLHSYEAASQRVRDLREGKPYSYPRLSEILSSGDSQHVQSSLRELGLTQIREGMLFDARQTALAMPAGAGQTELLAKIVQATTDLGRAYLADTDLQRQVRKRAFDFGFQTAKRIADPKDRTAAMGTVFFLFGGTFPNEEVRSEFSEMLDSIRTVSGDPKLKASLFIRLVQTNLASRATESRSLVSGPWSILEPGKGQPFLQENSQILDEAGKLISSLDSPADRASPFAQLVALDAQIFETEKARKSLAATVEDVERIADAKSRPPILLSLAQTLFLSGFPEEARKMFDKATLAASGLFPEFRRSNNVEELLLKRGKERLLADIVRGEGEIGLLSEAVETTGKIGEVVTRDKLYKILGHILLARGQYDQAEDAFNRLGDENWRRSCLKEVAFRRQWGMLEGSEE